MKFNKFLLFVPILSALACSTPVPPAANGASNVANSVKANVGANNSDNARPANVAASNAVENQNASPSEETEKTAPAAKDSACLKLRRDDMFLDVKQTFALDFPPFQKSCFATFHDPEFDDPPLGSRFFIYKNGKEIFEFPEQFNGGNAMCWVAAVAFEDVNSDNLKDVIVIGKCGAKSSDYNENMVYLNTGESFATNAKSNSEMMDFTKISQVKDFVRKNPALFAK